MICSLFFRELLHQTEKSVYCSLYYRIVTPTSYITLPFNTKTVETMSPTVKTNWDGTERRKPNSCRRKSERRSPLERRYDRREGAQKKNRTFYGWLRSLIKARLGVDRRKYIDQRVVADRRNPAPRSMLTKEELADLLK